VTEFTKKNNFTVVTFKNKIHFRECIHEQKNFVALAFKIKIISHITIHEQSNVVVANPQTQRCVMATFMVRIISSSSHSRTKYSYLGTI
jgi:hypothetical protein